MYVLLYTARGLITRETESKLMARFPSLSLKQMEVDAVEKHHRTRSKGVRGTLRQQYSVSVTLNGLER